MIKQVRSRADKRLRVVRDDKLIANENLLGLN